MVHIPPASEYIPGIEHTVLVQVQMVIPDKLLQVRGTQVCFLFSEGIFQVKAVHPELVWIDHHRVLRDLPGHPVMSADGLQPPDLMIIIEGNPVRLIGTVFLQQLCQPQHAFPRCADIGQHQHHDILFPDAAGHVFFLPCLCLLVNHQRIRRQHPRIGGDGFRSRHAYVGFIDAGGCPDAFLRIHAGAGSIAQRIVRQVDLHMGDLAGVFLRLILGVDHDQLLHIKMSVVRPGDHG